jgi:hypothetical protein
MSLLQEFYSELINKENRILICFDPNNETENFKKRLDQVNINVVFHTQLNSYFHFIESIEKQKFFLIISSSQFSSDIINYRQIEAIFIFSFNDDPYKHILDENTKIIGFYDNFKSFCSSIEQEIKSIKKEFYRWTLFDEDEYETKDLSKQSNEFLWFQLFHDVILHFPHDEKAKKEMIDSCYQNNLENEFEQNYQSKGALDYFIKNFFLNQMINEALRTKNIDRLYSLPYLRVDLINNLTSKHKQIRQSNRENLIVYRQMNLSIDEFNQLQQNKGKFISMKGFLMANTMRSVMRSSINRTDFISVLFEIECNIKELDDQVSFADINQSSLEEIFIFDFNTTYRLKNIQQNGQLWVIYLNVVNDERTILQKYIDDTHREIEDLRTCKDDSNMQYKDFGKTILFLSHIQD